MKSADQLDRELDAELRFHVEMEIDRNLARGLSPREARRQALIQFGGVEQHRDECREVRKGRNLDMLWQDLKFGVRSFIKTPGFTAVAVLTLALGIGANTAIFSLVYGVLLRPLPYLEGDKLVLIQQSQPLAGVDNMGVSIQELYDYREASQTVEGLVEYHGMSFTLLGGGDREPHRVKTGVVSANFFDVLGVEPLLGRTFQEGDDALGAEPVLILSHAYWQQSHGGDPGILGRAFELNDKAHTVVGVLPPIPQYPRENDVYMPTSACPFRAAGETAMVENRRAFGGLRVFGRVERGGTLADVQAEFATLAGRMQGDHPDVYPPERGLAASATSLQEELTRDARPTLLILLSTTALVLLIACANVANLTLARRLRRRRELAVRVALGAGRGRLIRQMLTESALLALLGGVLGVCLAYAGLDLLVAFTARFTPRAIGVEIDGWVLLFTLALSVVTGVVSGLIAAPPGDARLAASLKDAGSRTTSGGAGVRLRGALHIVGRTLAIGLVDPAAGEDPHPSESDL